MEKRNIPFDGEKFMAYLASLRTERELPWQELAKGIVRYGMLHFSEEEDELCRFLSEVIPDLSFGEAALFAGDGILSPYGRFRKACAEKLTGKEKPGREV